MATRNGFRLIFFLMLSFLTFGVQAQNVFVGKAGKEGKVLQKYIDPAELKKIVDQPVDSIWIVDVRSAKTFESGHIPTAKSFPVTTIQDKLSEIPKGKYLILYCTVGGNAQVVAKKLKKTGYKRYINWGGLSRWPGEKETGPSR